MTLLSKISIRLFFIILVSMSIFSLDVIHIYAAGPGEGCTTTGASDTTGGCVDSDPSDSKTAFCNVTSRVAGATGTCEECDLSEQACFRMYDRGTTNSYLHWTNLPQLPPIIEGQEKAMGVGLQPENWTGEKHAQFQMSYTGIGLASLMMVNPEIAKKMMAQGITPPQDAVGYLAQGISTITTSQPVNTAVYLADLGKQTGLYNPVYAQSGTGFSALEPILVLWKAFRNMAYLAFVVIFVVIGFMIMFRSKVSQQAVISIQLALPQIIITLLLITFSYAIASLMIDMIYFLIYLITGIFSTFGVLNDGGVLAQTKLIGSNLFGIAFKTEIAWDASLAFKDIFTQLVQGTVAQIVGGIASIFVYLIFAIAILISLFKLFFQLLMSYVGLIVSTIFAPIILLFNAIPGSQSFQKWLKGILANALVFPVTALMLLIAAALAGDTGYGLAPNIGYKQNTGMYNKIALPLLVGNGANGSGVDTNAFQALVAIGFLMMMPKVVELVQKALGVEGGIGGMIGGVMEGVQSGYHGLQKTQGYLFGKSQAEQQATGGVLSSSKLMVPGTTRDLGDVVKSLPGWLRGKR